MRKAQSLPLLAVAAGVLLLSPVTGYSLGTRIVDQDAEATARGDAFAATADNPSAIYYNPAGLTQQVDGLTALLGAYGILVQEHYQPLPGEKGGHDSYNHQEPQAAPQVYLAYRPTNSPVSSVRICCTTLAGNRLRSNVCRFFSRGNRDSFNRRSVRL